MHKWTQCLFVFTLYLYLSVENLPPLTFVSKKKALTTTAASQNRISQQGNMQFFDFF